jgi:GPH family glycoside/pentoside/hexuronide:cation symporter
MMNREGRPDHPRAPWPTILGYALGEGVVSLGLNGIAAFAMLYYTQALGLPFAQAGLVFAIASVWDALVDPAIGHLSDNTHLRWGRRLPYIFWGGLLMAVCFYYLWAVPGAVLVGGWLFPYVLALNLLMRTAYAVFSVPYAALGYEICNDYHERSQLQGVRTAMNMTFNIVGVAVGWSLFFPDNPGGPEATSHVPNYLRMGSAFAAAMLLLTLVLVVTMRRHATDTRGLVTGTGNTARAFYADFREIVGDRHLRRIIAMACIGYTGATFVATLQMYLYVYFMHLTSLQKTVVHGGGMVLCGLGALVGARLARIFDKSPAACIGAGIAVVFDLAAAVIFLGRILEPTSTWTVGGQVIPAGVVVFGLCDMMNWFGVGIFGPLAMSMLADLSEVNERDTGVRKDGGYAAIFAFLTKLILSVSVFAASACLSWVGFAHGSDTQTESSIRWLVLLTFGLGALFSALVIPIMRGYKVDRAYMTAVRAELAARKAAAT